MDAAEIFFHSNLFWGFSKSSLNTWSGKFTVCLYGIWCLDMARVFHVFIRHMNVYFSTVRLDMIGLERDQTSDRDQRQCQEGKGNKVTCILIVTMMLMLTKMLQNVTDLDYNHSIRPQ